jgi:hypothetical protein
MPLKYIRVDVLQNRRSTARWQAKYSANISNHDMNYLSSSAFLSSTFDSYPFGKEMNTILLASGLVQACTKHYIRDELSQS